MKFQDTSIHHLKVKKKSGADVRTSPKQYMPYIPTFSKFGALYCPTNFFKVGGITISFSLDTGNKMIEFKRMSNVPVGYLNGFKIPNFRH